MPDLHRRLREGPRPRARGAAARRARGRRPALLPRCSSGRPLPVVEMEGAERIMLGSNNYLGLTGDERVMQGAARRARPLRHRPHRLAPAQRHDPAAPRARARDRRMDGHRGRARLHHRPPGQRRHARHDPRPRRHRRSPTPATTPRSSTAACCRAPSCARSATTASTSSRRCSSARSGDGGGVLVVVDGVFSMEGDIAPLPEIAELCAALRRAADGRRGARRRRARRARRRRGELLGVEDLVDLRMGTFSKSLASCGGFIAGPGRGDRVPALSSRARSCSPPRRCRPPSAPRWRRCGSCRSAEGRELLARVLDNAALPAATACAERGFAGRRAHGSRCAPAGARTIVTPIVPVLVGDDWKAALLWKALYDAGVFVNVAAPPRRAARRRAAADERDGDPRRGDDRPRARHVRAVKRDFEAEHGPLPGPDAPSADA